MMVQGAGDGQTPLVAAPKATKNGYVYVYLSNETPNMPVYFDNLNITQTRGPIIEDNAYYPFGLKIQGISAKAAGKIKAKEGYQANYNQQDDETGYDEFAVRFYDPQIGRWLQVDPNIVQPGMYNGMNNDPINFTDPSGGDPDPNWYLNDETREIEFFEGSAEKKGYKNLGETYNGWVTGADGETRWTNFLSNGTYTRFLDNVTVGNGATLFRQKIEKELDGIMEDYDSRHSISQLNDDGSLNKREYDPHANAFWTGANFFSNTFVSMYNGVHGMYQMAQHPAEAVNNLAYRYAGAQFYLMTNSTGQVLSDAGSFIKNKATDVHTYEDALALAATIAVSKGNFGASGGAMTLDQIALKDLVKEATLNGRKALTVADTKIVTELANEVKYPGFRATLEDMNPINNHWGGGAHIHLPGIRSGHIPIQ
jgi:RHS repeat-associated protein